MLEPDALFHLSSTLAMVGWLALLILSRYEVVTRLVIPVGLCGLLGFLYLYLIINHMGGAEGGFGSLSDVPLLFQNPNMLLAGWVHYLAFDLFIGCWEVRDARRHQISIFLIIPALFLTFMFGPVGLLAYLLIRFIRTRSVVLDEHQILPD